MRRCPEPHPSSRGARGRLAALTSVLLLAACGHVYKSWEDCYVEMTANRTSEVIGHVEHCDKSLALTHASGSACPTDHASHKIKTEVLNAHCQSVK